MTITQQIALVIFGGGGVLAASLMAYAHGRNVGRAIGFAKGEAIGWQRGYFYHGAQQKKRRTHLGRFMAQNAPRREDGKCASEMQEGNQ